MEQRSRKCCRLACPPVLGEVGVPPRTMPSGDTVLQIHSPDPLLLEREFFKGAQKSESEAYKALVCLKKEKM